MSSFGERRWFSSLTQGARATGTCAALPQPTPGLKVREFLSRAEASLDVALQPIVDVNSGQIFGCEALARNYETLGCKTPPALFDQAALLQSVADLDIILANKGLAKFANATMLRDALLFINIDGRSFGSRTSIKRQLLQCLNKARMDPGDVCIEISELNRILLGDDFVKEIESLRNVGFKIGLDDFGAGYSGLQMLHQANPDYIKIDRYFINGIDKDVKKKFFVQSIAQIAHTLGAKVIAKGVEDFKEHHLVRDIGCDLVQGHFSARPAADIETIKPISENIAKNLDRRKTDHSLNMGKCITQCATINTDSNFNEVLRIFKKHSKQKVIPVLDKRNMPVGVIKESDICPIMYHRFGAAFLSSKQVDYKITKYIQRIPTTDINSSIQNIIEINADDLEDGIIVTQSLAYAGFVPPSSLFRAIFCHQLMQVRRQNPLSGLPGNDCIKEYVEQSTEDRGVAKVFAYFDFDNFKPFNDRYGFRLGDRSIMLFVDILQETFSGKEFFIGHVGGDDFFVGASGVGEIQAIEYALTAVDQFKHQAASLYCEEDRAAGFIQGVARDGRKTRYDLLSCSVGIVRVPEGGSTTTAECISRKIAQAKKAAKQSEAGYAIFNVE